MAKVGYARVSSREQDLTVQLEKLNVCDKIFEEKQSGIDSNRPRLNEQQIKDLKEQRAEGSTIKELMREFGLGKVSVYKYLNS